MQGLKDKVYIIIEMNNYVRTYQFAYLFLVKSVNCKVDRLSSLLLATTNL